MQVSSAEKHIWDQLRMVIDPELGINIVDLGLVYEVQVRTIQKTDGEQLRVHIVYTLTTPGCPLAQVISEKIIEAVSAATQLVVRRENITSELVFDPPWTADMMSEQAKEELEFML